MDEKKLFKLMIHEWSLAWLEKVLEEKPMAPKALIRKYHADLVKKKEEWIVARLAFHDALYQEKTAPNPLKTAWGKTMKLVIEESKTAFVKSHLQQASQSTPDAIEKAKKEHEETVQLTLHHYQDSLIQLQRRVQEEISEAPADKAAKKRRLAEATAWVLCHYHQILPKQNAEKMRANYPIPSVFGEIIEVHSWEKFKQLAEAAAPGVLNELIKTVPIEKTPSQIEQAHQKLRDKSSETYGSLCINLKEIEGTLGSLLNKKPDSCDNRFTTLKNLIRHHKEEFVKQAAAFNQEKRTPDE